MIMPVELSYLLLDGARKGDHLRRLKEIGPTCRSLFKSRGTKELQTVAPHLFVFDTTLPVMDWLRTEGWQFAGGIFLYSPASFDICYEHLRQLLFVKAPDGKELYFRYYDPS